MEMETSTSTSTAEASSSIISSSLPELKDEPPNVMESHENQTASTEAAAAAAAAADTLKNEEKEEKENPSTDPLPPPLKSSTTTKPSSKSPPPNNKTPATARQPESASSSSSLSSSTTASLSQSQPSTISSSSNRNLVQQQHQQQQQQSSGGNSKGSHHTKVHPLVLYENEPHQQTQESESRMGNLKNDEDYPEDDPAEHCLLSLPIDSLHCIASFLSPTDLSSLSRTGEAAYSITQDVIRRVRMHGFRCATEVVTAWMVGQHADARELAALYIKNGVPIYPYSLGHSYHTIIWRMDIELKAIQESNSINGDTDDHNTTTNTTTNGVPQQTSSSTTTMTDTNEQGQVDEFYNERHTNNSRNNENDHHHRFHHHHHNHNNHNNNDDNNPNASYLEEKAMYWSKQKEQRHSGGGATTTTATTARRMSGTRGGTTTNPTTSSTSSSTTATATRTPMKLQIHQHLVDQHYMNQPKVDDEKGSMKTQPINLSADFYHPHFPSSSSTTPQQLQEDILKEILVGNTDHGATTPSVPTVQDGTATSTTTNNTDTNSWLPPLLSSEATTTTTTTTTNGGTSSSTPTNKKENEFDNILSNIQMETYRANVDSHAAAAAVGSDSSGVEPPQKDTPMNDNGSNAKEEQVGTTTTQNEGCDDQLHRHLSTRFAHYQKRVVKLLTPSPSLLQKRKMNTKKMMASPTKTPSHALEEETKDDNHDTVDECVLDLWDEFFTRTANIHFYDHHTAVPRIANMHTFLTTPCPKDVGIIQCEIERIKINSKKKGAKSMTGRFFPLYEYRLFIRDRRRHPNSTTGNLHISSFVDDAQHRQDTVLMVAKNKGRKHSNGLPRDSPAPNLKKGVNNYYLYMPEQSDIQSHYVSVRGDEDKDNSNNGGSSSSSSSRKKKSKSKSSKMEETTTSSSTVLHSNPGGKSTHAKLLGRLQSNFTGTEFQIYNPITRIVRQHPAATTISATSEPATPTTGTVSRGAGITSNSADSVASGSSVMSDDDDDDEIGGDGNRDYNATPSTPRGRSAGTPSSNPTTPISSSSRHRGRSLRRRLSDDLWNTVRRRHSAGATQRRRSLRRGESTASLAASTNNSVHGDIRISDDDDDDNADLPIDSTRSASSRATLRRTLSTPPMFSPRRRSSWSSRRANASSGGGTSEYDPQNPCNNDYNNITSSMTGSSFESSTTAGGEATPSTRLVRGEEENGVITYTANLLGNRPRIMDVCIPKVSDDGVAGADWRQYLDQLQNQQHQQQQQQPLQQQDNATQQDFGIPGAASGGTTTSSTNTSNNNRMLQCFKQLQQQLETNQNNNNNNNNAAGENNNNNNNNNNADDTSVNNNSTTATMTNSNVDNFGLLALQNRPPWWNVELGAFVLNFGGRVSVASVKNFQLCNRTDQDYIMLQFGRTQGRHSFTMDFQYPLTAVQAFAIAISSLQSKISFG